MNPRRILVLSFTLLLAAGAGYGLLGLRAPKQAPATPAAPAVSDARQTIIAVGPDGTLYEIQAPSGAASTRAYRGGGGYEREDGGGYADGYEHE